MLVYVAQASRADDGTSNTRLTTLKDILRWLSPIYDLMDFFQSPLFKKTPYKARHTVFFIWLKCYFRCFVSPPLILSGQDIMQKSIICHAVAWCMRSCCAATQAPRSEFFRSGDLLKSTPSRT
jgi:hypothetical protein